jgi:hypothetical protein
MESMRIDPSKFDVLIHCIPSTVVMSKSTIIDYTGSNSGYHTNPFLYCSNQNGYDETLEVLVNEAVNLYEKMVEDFTNQTITNAAPDSNTTLLPTIIYSNKQTLCLLVLNPPSIKMNSN